LTEANEIEPEKIDLLELKDEARENLITEIRKNLRLKLEEAKVWRTLAQYGKISINGVPIETAPPQAAPARSRKLRVKASSRRSFQDS
jgi:3-oxoacyl-[acyl-carrier-protein] synthase III